MSKKKKINPQADAFDRLMAKALRDMMGKSMGVGQPIDHANPPNCYETKSRTGEVVTLDIAPGIELPIEIVGTHESRATLRPIDEHVTTSGTMVYEHQGREVESGYHLEVDDGTIFACMQGLHIRISLTALFQAITTPDMRQRLDAACDQFNALNNAKGAGHYHDGTH